MLHNQNTKIMNYQESVSGDTETKTKHRKERKFTIKSLPLHLLALPGVHY